MLRKIQKKLKQATNCEKLFIQGKYYVILNVKYVLSSAKLMDTMKTIQNHWKLFGCVQNVIFTTIKNIDFTLREQAKRLRNEMRCSDLQRKPVETHRNDVSATVMSGYKVTDCTNDLWIQNLRSTGI